MLIDQVDIKFPELSQLKRKNSYVELLLIISLVSKNEKKVAKKILNVDIYIKILLFKKLERKTKIKKLIKGKKIESKYILSF